MKLLVSVFVFLVAPFLKVNIKPVSVDRPIEKYSKTGYDQFSDLYPIEENVKIIHDMTDEEIENELSGLKKKFIGESEKILNKYADGKYVTTTIFSRSNKTREAFSFSYDTSSIKYSIVSVSVKGTLNVKGAIKDKSGEISIGGEIVGTLSAEMSKKDTVNDEFSVTIYPGKKVTLRVAGDCKISNGVKKVYALGIRLRKGAWEVIDITSTCCELIEEDA